jgi:hypothetical protein
MVVFSSRNVAFALSLWSALTQGLSLAQIPLYSLAPVPLKVSETLFPTAGPLIAAVSLLATIDPDGRVSETQVLDSIGTTTGEVYEGTLIGYIEDSVAAVKQWEFRRTINIRGKEVAVSTRAVPRETHSLASNCRFCTTRSPNG